MNKSENIKNIAKALITFHLKVDKIRKDSTNPFFKSKYASLSTILDAINLPLNESGLSFCQFPTGSDGLTTILMHGETGEFIEATYEMKPVKDDPQGRGSVLTYQRRYALASVLGLNIDDDDDANAGVKKSEPTTVKADDERPWLSDTQYKQLLARVESGDKEAYYKADKAFRMKKDYRDQLNLRLKSLLKQPA